MVEQECNKSGSDTVTECASGLHTHALKHSRLHKFPWEVLPRLIGSCHASPGNTIRSAHMTNKSYSQSIRVKGQNNETSGHETNMSGNYATNIPEAVVTTLMIIIVLSSSSSSLPPLLSPLPSLIAKSAASQTSQERLYSLSLSFSLLLLLGCEGKYRQSEHPPRPEAHPDARSSLS